MIQPLPTRSELQLHVDHVEGRLRKIVLKMVQQAEDEDLGTRDHTRVVLTTVKYLEYCRGIAGNLDEGHADERKDLLENAPASMLVKMQKSIDGELKRRAQT